MGLDDLSQLLSKFLLCSRHVILAGAFNIDLMSNCTNIVNYQHVLCDFQLTQYVTGPSRVTEYSSTLIDHHIVGMSEISVSDIRQAIGLSDHQVQILDLDITVQHPCCFLLGSSFS